MKRGRVEMSFSKGNVLDHQWNDLTCTLETCLFEPKAQFRVIVEAFEIENWERNQAAFYGVSQTIT